MFDARATAMQSIDLMLLPGFLDVRSSGSGATARTSSRIASRIGIIMAQAAVLEIHIDRKAVASMKPKRNNVFIQNCPFPKNYLISYIKYQ